MYNWTGQVIDDSANEVAQFFFLKEYRSFCTQAI
jgi:hypothetical protein